MHVRDRVRPAIVGAAALVAALAAACGSDGGNSATSATSSPAASSKATGESANIAVSMKDNFFEPTDITVNRGAAITFAVKNDGQAIHDMHIMSLAAEGKDYLSNATVQPGETSSFTATFTKAGTLKFQCDYHLPDMVGTITVK